MIRFIEPFQRLENHSAIRAYFKLRKRVFCDELGWVEPKPGGVEYDAYDDLYNVYVLHIDRRSGELGGGVRLMPTTGRTLLHDVWSDMLPDPGDFRSPNIWEATRFCMSERPTGSRSGGFAEMPALKLLAVGLLDFCTTNGITHIIAVCEMPFFEMTGSFGVEVELVSTRRDANGVEIGCGLWETGKGTRNLPFVRTLTHGPAPLLSPAGPPGPAARGRWRRARNLAAPWPD